MGMRKFTDNQGFTLMSTVMAMGIAAGMMAATSDMIAITKRSDDVRFSVNKVRDLMVEDTSICTATVKGRNYDVAAWVDYTLPVPNMPTGVTATISYSSPREISPVKVVAPAQVMMVVNGSLKKTFPLTAIVTKSNATDLGQDCHFAGGTKTAAQTCNEVGGTAIDGNPGVCFFGDESGNGNGFLATINAYANFATDEIPYATYINYLDNVITKGYLDTQVVEIANMVLALNADPGIAAATKTALTDALTRMVADPNGYSAYNNLGIAIQTNNATNVVMASMAPLATRAFWQRIGPAPAPTPVVFSAAPLLTAADWGLAAQDDTGTPLVGCNDSWTIKIFRNGYERG